jgi:hypothetical protein
MPFSASYPRNPHRHVSGIGRTATTGEAIVLRASPASPLAGTFIVSRFGGVASPLTVRSRLIETYFHCCGFGFVKENRQGDWAEAMAELSDVKDEIEFEIKRLPSSRFQAKLHLFAESFGVMFTADRDKAVRHLQ